INPLPEMSRLNHILRSAYIFFASALLIPISFYYIVIQKSLYLVYQSAMFEFIRCFTPIHDQLLAISSLNIFKITSYIVALLFILIIWRQKEEEDDDSENKKNIRYARGVVVHLPNKDDRPKK